MTDETPKHNEDFVENLVAQKLEEIRDELTEHLKQTIKRKLEKL